MESFTYDPVAGKQVPVVLTDGRMPAAPDEIVLAPLTASELHAATGSTIRLTGGTTAMPVTVTGIGFVPAGPHNEYSDGAWLTPAGYDRLFRGAHYRVQVPHRRGDPAAGRGCPGGGAPADAAAAAIKGGQAFTFDAPGLRRPKSRQLRDVAVLPLALSAFLALLAVGAVGHALSIASAAAATNWPCCGRWA